MVTKLCDTGISSLEREQFSLLILSSEDRNESSKVRQKKRACMMGRWQLLAVTHRVGVGIEPDSPPLPVTTTCRELNPIIGVIHGGNPPGRTTQPSKR